jgi:mannose/fructose/N-acetylgalactosamine-specific phosphotransferase system component IID
MRSLTTQRRGPTSAWGVPLLSAALRRVMAAAAAMLALAGGWLIAGRNLAVWVAMVLALLWAVVAIAGFYLAYRVLHGLVAAVYCRALLFAARRVP